MHLKPFIHYGKKNSRNGNFFFISVTRNFKTVVLPFQGRQMTLAI